MMTTPRPLDLRLEQNANDISSIYDLLSGVDVRFDHVDSRLDAHDVRFDQIDARLDARFDSVDAALGGLSAQIGEILTILTAERT